MQLVCNDSKNHSCTKKKRKTKKENKELIDRCQENRTFLIISFSINAKSFP